MNAIEFVKSFGWRAAKSQLNDPKLVYGVQVDYQFMRDLQNLVNAYELVESFGGLDGAKDHLNHRREYGLYSLPTLKQAIDLVEQCNAKP